MQRPVRLPGSARNMVLGAFCLAGAATCGDSTVFVRVNVDGLPAQTATVAVKPFVGTVSYGQELFAVSASDKTLTVGFKLPADTRGAFRVDVEPRGTDGSAIKLCDVPYSGSATAEITEPISTTVSVTLDATLPDSGLNKDLHAIWGSASNDVWVVGAGGQMGHWNGCYWRNVPSGTQRTLRGVHGFLGPTKDIWAVGGDSPTGLVTIVHSANRGDFEAAGMVMNGQLNDVWGSATDRLWAVGTDSSGNGMILRNGTGQANTWLPDPGLTGTGLTSSFYAIDGLDNSNVYAVGKAADFTCTGGCRGSLAIYNGTTWQRPTYTENRGLEIQQVYAEPQVGGGKAIWLGAAGGVLLDTDGVVTSGSVSLSLDIPGSPYPLFQGLIGFASMSGLYFTLAKPDEPGAFSLYVGGSGLATPVSTTGDPITEQTMALWGTGPSDIWIVGKNGARYHYDGTALKKYTAPL